MYITRRNRITVFENEMLSNLAKLRSCLLVVQRGEEGGLPYYLIARSVVVACRRTRIFNGLYTGIKESRGFENIWNWPAEMGELNGQQLPPPFTVLLQPPPPIQIAGNFAESEIGRWTNRKWHSVVHFHRFSTLEQDGEFGMK